MTGAATYLWLAIADHELPDGAIARASAIPLDGGVPLHLAAWLLADRPKGLRVAKERLSGLARSDSEPPAAVG